MAEVSPQPSPLAVIDLDGVIADVRHRLHHLKAKPKDWDAFFAAAARHDEAHPEGLGDRRDAVDGPRDRFLTAVPSTCARRRWPGSIGTTSLVTGW